VIVTVLVPLLYFGSLAMLMFCSTSGTTPFTVQYADFGSNNKGGFKTWLGYQFVPEVRHLVDALPGFWENLRANWNR